MVKRAQRMATLRHSTPTLMAFCGEGGGVRFANSPVGTCPRRYLMRSFVLAPEDSLATGGSLNGESARLVLVFLLRSIFLLHNVSPSA